MSLEQRGLKWFEGPWGVEQLLALGWFGICGGLGVYGVLSLWQASYYDGGRDAFGGDDDDEFQVPLGPFEHPWAVRAGRRGARALAAALAGLAIGGTVAAVRFLT